VLLVAGLILARDEQGRLADPRELERKAVGKMAFRVESATVTTSQRVMIRKLMLKAGVSAKPGEESDHAEEFLEKLLELAGRAGGEPPQPVRPDTSSIEEMRRTAGNERLLALFNRREDLSDCIDNWTGLARRVAERLPRWNVLKRLAVHSSKLPDADAILAQVQTIERERQLLEEPDPITPLAANITQLLRDELNSLDGQYASLFEQRMGRLEQDPNWRELEPDERLRLLSHYSLDESSRPAVNVQSTEGVLETLEGCSLPSFADRVAALSGRFDNVLKRAAELCQPEVQFIQVPRRTLKTEEEIDAWAAEMTERLKTALKQGPVALG